MNSSSDWTQYKCDACRDAGFVHPCDADGKPIWRRVIPCPACGGPRQEDNGFRYERSGIGRQMLLENFDHALPGVAEAFRLASDMAIGKADFIWLIIYGRPGNGKTHLAKGAGIEVLKRGKVVKYYYVPTLLAEMRKGMDTNKYPGSTPTEQIVDEACFCRLLILDDLGAENFTAWAGARIEEIISRRYEENKELIVTTNKALSDFPRPILSRFMDTTKSRVVENKGQDYRRLKKEGHG